MFIYWKANPWDPSSISDLALFQRSFGSLSHPLAQSLHFISYCSLLSQGWRPCNDSAEPLPHFLSVFPIQGLLTPSRCWACCVFSRLRFFFFFPWRSFQFIPSSASICFPFGVLHETHASQSPSFSLAGTLSLTVLHLSHAVTSSSFSRGLSFLGFLSLIKFSSSMVAFQVWWFFSLCHAHQGMRTVRREHEPQQGVIFPTKPCFQVSGDIFLITRVQWCCEHSTLPGKCLPTPSTQQ